MKLTALLLLTGFLQVSARGTAQTVTYSAKSVALTTVFSEIKKQTGYVFFYNKEFLDGMTPVTVQFDHTPLRAALATMLANLPVSFDIQANTIVITQKEIQGSSTPVISPGITLPPIDIHGRVTDSLGNPLAGASVTVKGSKFVTATNDKGEFFLRGIDPRATVIISNVGYEPQTIHIGDRSVFNLILKQKIGQLDETQIIAYGTSTQRFSVGSYSKVTAEDIESQPVTNPLQALEGQVPGLVVTQSSGVPGASLQIQIRGQNSLMSSPNGNIIFDNPLFIIDGVPFAPQNSNINQFGSLVTPIPSSGITGLSSQGYSPFNSISPSDIESIEVLRDADATAIYGSRGANGVILITTKKGKAGKIKLNMNVWTGASQVTHSMPMMNTQQYLSTRREALKNDNATASITNSPDLLVFDTTRYTNFNKYFVGGTANTTDAKASLSGGTTNSQFIIGAGYHNETYVYPGDYSDNRITINSNYHHNSTDKKITIDLSANYSYDQNNSSNAQQVLSTFTQAPDYPDLLNPNGTLNWNYKGVDLFNNALAYLKQPYLIKNYNLLSSLQLNYEVLPGLTLGSSFGYNTFNVNEFASYPLAAQDPSTNPVSSANFGVNNFQTWIIEPQAVFKRYIHKARLDILLGSTFQKNTNSSTDITGSNYANDLSLGSISAAGITSASDSYNLYKYSALFGRVNYILNNQYIVDINGRHDGSSRFGPGKQFGNFGSIGAGWIFSENLIIKKMFPILSYGKIKGSFGTTGNDNIGNYQYFSSDAPLSGRSYQGSAGYTPQNLYNPNFSWAINKKMEASLDLGLFKDRILVNATWYQNRSGNQLVQYELPIQTGFGSVTQNAPYTVQNRGWEIQLGSNNIKTRSFSWTTRFNITIPKNILLSFPGLASSPYANIYVIGKSLSVLQKYKYIGLNDTTGRFQFESIKGIQTYSPAAFTDYRVIGNQDPKFYGGLSNSLSYKALTLNIFVQYTKQLGANYIGEVYANELVGSYNHNVPTTFLSRWQQPGDHSSFQKFSQTYGSVYRSGAYFANSSGAYGDASYVRLKNISLSYNIPTSLLNKIKVTACNIFVNTQNIFTLTHYKGNDPETQNQFSLPLKTLVAGIQLTL